MLAGVDGLQLASSLAVSYSGLNMPRHLSCLITVYQKSRKAKVTEVPPCPSQIEVTWSHHQTLMGRAHNGLYVYTIILLKLVLKQFIVSFGWMRRVYRVPEYSCEQLAISYKCDYL